MQFNQEAFLDFWGFINERHRIFLKKEQGFPKPWTPDPILQKWRFCNVFRNLDTQSRWLIKKVIEPHWEDDPALMIFNIYAFRAFNWWPTYHGITSNWTGNGDAFIYSWNPERILDIIYSMISEGDTKLTSGAYMIRGREGMPKYESIVQTLTEIWEAKDELALRLWAVGSNSLEEYQKLLMERKFWGWGAFTTYQIVLDLTYTKWLEHAVDINTWCEFGPGAVKGIREIYPELPKNMILDAARGLLLDSPKFLEPHVPTLTLQDIEFSLCELQKYRRIKNGGRSKQHYAGS